MFLCLFFMIMIMIIILSKQTKDINCEQGFEDHLSQKTHKTVDFCSVTSVLLTTRYIHTLANKNVFYGKKKEQKKNIIFVVVGIHSGRLHSHVHLPSLTCT